GPAAESEAGTSTRLAARAARRARRRAAWRRPHPAPSPKSGSRPQRRRTLAASSSHYRQRRLASLRYALVREQSPLQRRQPAPLERFDGFVALTDDRRGLLHRQIGDDAEDQHVTLVRRELVEQPPDSFTSQAVEHVFFGIASERVGDGLD